MAYPGGSDGAPMGKDVPQPSSSSSSSSSSFRSSINSTLGTKLKNAKRLSIEHLELITDNFSPERVIGRGTYGTVYKGVYDDGKYVAVKVLHKNTTGTDNGEFKHEFESLMRLKHQNIIQLVSFCYETQHKPMLHNGETIFAEDICKALCFEYMPNGNLKEHISVECDGLEWHTRYKVIKGICEGLKYLHEEFKEPIYHLDLKPENILLDENMVPKLADFGSSKLFSKELTMVIPQNLAATIGYVPPEYYSHQVVSKKFDIYSLGVVMTKIIAGPRGNSLSAEMDYQDFLDQVHENWKKRFQEKWHNSKLLQAYCRQVNKCITIALSCMDFDRFKRPGILDIIDKLNKTETVINELDPDHQWTSQRITMGDKSKNEAKATWPKNLSIRVLQEMTDNFSEERLIGRGAYGKVYKGKLENGEEIAVKLFYDSIADEKFQYELDIIMMLNHPNIVRVFGYCWEIQHEHVEFQGKTVLAEHAYRALCFEYMCMGSLQDHISDESCGLDWQTRYKIIKGTCEGLKYLHKGLKKSIYHLDLKPDNVLLDENMMPKLAGFNLAKTFGEEKSWISHASEGTMRYMPPEYIDRGIISKKSDVFSLGVVMTMIITGPNGRYRSYATPYQEFVDQVHANWRNRLEATSTSSETLDAYCEQVSICTKLALRCIEEDRYIRPSIVDMVEILDATETTLEERRPSVETTRERTWVPQLWFFPEW